MSEAVRFRWSPRTDAVLAELLADMRRWRYGYDLLKATGLGAGTVYPILVRLAERGWLETKWDTTLASGPRRHLYRLTSRGVREAKSAAHERVLRTRRSSSLATGDV